MLILDEVHHLDDPSRLLKIAADAYPNLKVLATGSSTLAATRKFRDSPTGRKQATPSACAEKGWGAIRDDDRGLLRAKIRMRNSRIKRATLFIAPIT